MKAIEVMTASTDIHQAIETFIFKTAKIDVKKAIELVDTKVNRRMEYHAKNMSGDTKVIFNKEFRNACALYGISEQQYIDVVVEKISKEY